MQDLNRTTTGDRDQGQQSKGRKARDIWAPDNHIAWCAVPFDELQRTPPQRACMLRELRFRFFAYDWRAEHVSQFEDELASLKKEGIELLAWWFPLEADNPIAVQAVELFRKYDFTPQLWVMQKLPDRAEVLAEARKGGFAWDVDEDSMFSMQEISASEHDDYMRSIVSAIQRLEEKHFPQSDDAQAARISSEVERLSSLADLAGRFGCKVGLYNHGGWFGMMTNQLAIIEELKRRGTSNAGIVYNFSHCRTAHYDDSENFAEVWASISPCVLALNLAGIHFDDGTALALGSGDQEARMIRIVDQSDWVGPVGLVGETGGDMAQTLTQARKSLADIIDRFEDSGTLAS